jgi:5'-nucleotidase
VDIMVAGGGDELLASEDDLLLPSNSADDVFGPYPMYARDADSRVVPVVTTSGGYGYLGKLTVGFNSSGEIIEIDDGNSGPVRVVSTAVGADGVEPDADMHEEVVEPVEEFVADLATTVIGVSEVDLDGRRDTVRAVESNQGSLIADALLWQAAELASDFGMPEPNAALQNGGGIRNDSIVPAGDITELDTFDMVPFPNYLSIVPDISRDHFKEILENAVSRTQPGDIPGGTGRFAQIGGFSFSYSASGVSQVQDADGSVITPGTRVQDVTLNDGTVIVSGGVVQPGATVTIATIDFLARGGDEYPFRGAAFTTVGASYQQALSAFIEDALNGEITADDYPEGGEGRIVELP